MEELDHLKRETIYLLNLVIEGSKNNAGETVTESLNDVLHKYLTEKNVVIGNAICEVSSTQQVISDIRVTIPILCVSMRKSNYPYIM